MPKLVGALLLLLLLLKHSLLKLLLLHIPLHILWCDWRRRSQMRCKALLCLQGGMSPSG